MNFGPSTESAERDRRRHGVRRRVDPRYRASGVAPNGWLPDGAGGNRQPGRHYTDGYHGDDGVRRRGRSARAFLGRVRDPDRAVAGAQSEDPLADADSGKDRVRSGVDTVDDAARAVRDQTEPKPVSTIPRPPSIGILATSCAPAGRSALATAPKTAPMAARTMTASGRAASDSHAAPLYGRRVKARLRVTASLLRG